MENILVDWIGHQFFFAILGQATKQNLKFVGIKKFALACIRFVVQYVLFYWDKLL